MPYSQQQEHLDRHKITDQSKMVKRCSTTTEPEHVPSTYGLTIPSLQALTI